MSLPDWFDRAKLGIFIHWGIYSVDGVSESWSFFNGKVSYNDYMAQAKRFTAAKYDPAAWARLFKLAGADYAVLTTKHHDGFALWDTAQNDLSVVKRTPAGRDLVGPFCESLRAEGLRVGLYFSHLDWSHPDYSSVMREGDPNPEHTLTHYDKGGFAYPRKGQPEDPVAWQRFLRFHRAQLEELCRRFAPDLLWFDGDWERSPNQWDFAGLRAFLKEMLPEVALNSRMGGHGDYATPEQGVPIHSPIQPWEFCMTINDSWGYQPQDANHKSHRQIVRTFCEVIGMGGRLLLDAGPLEDGTFQPVQEDRLRELGSWIERHAEAVKGTRAGLPHGHFLGSSALSEDRRSLYLFFYDVPNGPLPVKGLIGEIEAVSLVAGGERIGHSMVGGAPWMGIPGVLWIDLPKEAIDPAATVIRVRFKEPLKLYQGHGEAITQN
jgi:alpha-L-fucosidase